jgi:hypothetical protein
LIGLIFHPLDAADTKTEPGIFPGHFGPCFFLNFSTTINIIIGKDTIINAAISPKVTFVIFFSLPLMSAHQYWMMRNESIMQCFVQSGLKTLAPRPFDHRM